MTIIFLKFWNGQIHQAKKKWKINFFFLFGVWIGIYQLLVWWKWLTRKPNSLLGLVSRAPCPFYLSCIVTWFNGLVCECVVLRYLHLAVSCRVTYQISTHWVPPGEPVRKCGGVCMFTQSSASVTTYPFCKYVAAWLLVVLVTTSVWLNVCMACLRRCPFEA